MKKLFLNPYVVGAIFLVIGFFANLYFDKNDVSNFWNSFISQFTPFAICLIIGMIFLSIWITKLKNKLNNLISISENQKASAKSIGTNQVMKFNEFSKVNKIVKEIIDKNFKNDYENTVAKIQDSSGDWDDISKSSIKYFLSKRLIVKGSSGSAGNYSWKHYKLTQLGEHVHEELL